MLLATIALAFLPQSETTETVLPPVVERFMESARSRKVDSLVPLLAPDAEITELHTLFELLGQAPFELEAQAAPWPNGDRALARMWVTSHLDKQRSEFWFWLKGKGEQQRLYQVHGDPRWSRDWLYEKPKEGTAPTPKLAAENLFQAMRSGAEEQAESLTADLAWRPNGGDLHSLFITAHTTGLGFVVETPRTIEDRSAVTFGFEIEGKRQGQATLYVEKRGSGWIATGFDRDADHTRLFLKGERSATIWPKSPFDAYAEFTGALTTRNWIRMGSVSSATYWHENAGLAEWRSRARSRAILSADSQSVRVQGNRAFGWIQSNAKNAEPVYCLMSQTAGGWRITGHCSEEEQAQAFLNPEPNEHPKPK